MSVFYSDKLHYSAANPDVRGGMSRGGGGGRGGRLRVVRSTKD